MKWQTTSRSEPTLSKARSRVKRNSAFLTGRHFIAGFFATLSSFAPHPITAKITLTLLLTLNLAYADSESACESQREPCTETITIASAANFTPTLRELAAQFRQQKMPNLAINIVSGSSGKLTTQILQSAPFDLFFSADQQTIDRLIDAGVAGAKSRVSYARGQLILVSHNPQISSPEQALRNGRFNKIAIANPRLAPYGRAALEALQSALPKQDLSDRLLKGENVTQAYQFVLSANADLGFVAASQLIVANKIAQVDSQSSMQYWTVPPELYKPILQDAVVINGTSKSTAQRFLDYLSSPSAKSILRRSGYLPGNTH